MSKLVLEFHDWRLTKPDDDNQLIAMFMFSLANLDSRQAGIRLDHEHTFWTEVNLSRDLANRGRWPQTSKQDKIKAMFRWAQERIVERGGKLRQAPMFWTATSALGEGPPDTASVQFPKAPPLTFEITDELVATELNAREAAGLNK